MSTGALRPWGMIGALAVAALLGCAHQKQEARTESIAWNTSYQAALADAGKNNRPILMDMYTDWCEWCKALDDTTYTDPRFIEYSKRFTMARMNAEVDTVTAAHYRVRSYPTVLVLRKDGTEIERVVGYERAPAFIAEVQNYLAGRNTLALYAAMEPDSGKDPGYEGRLAERYLYHGLYDEARARFQKLIAMDPKNASGLVDDALYNLARMSRKEKDYASDRKYAQEIIDRYPDSDMYRAAILETAGALRRDGKLAQARSIYLDYVKRFPTDGDAAAAKEQADTLNVQIQRGKGA